MNNNTSQEELFDKQVAKITKILQLQKEQKTFRTQKFSPNGTQIGIAVPTTPEAVKQSTPKETPFNRDTQHTISDKEIREKRTAKVTFLKRKINERKQDIIKDIKQDIKQNRKSQLNEDIKKLQIPTHPQKVPTIPINIKNTKKCTHISPFRWILWIIEILILLICLHRYVLTPHFQGNKQKITPLEQTNNASSENKIFPLGEKGFLLPHCQEVTPSYYPNVDLFPTAAKKMLLHQQNCSLSFHLPIEIQNSIGIKFRLVPPGTTQIGSPITEWKRGENENQHPITISQPFYISKFEITQQEWETIMGKDQNPSSFPGMNCPVEEVSWYDCMEFIKKLCNKENVDPHSYALPSESEWEYACRGGSETAFCFGNSQDLLKDWAEYADNNYKRTSIVGNKRSNSLGIYDMHGNVWEWCRDKFQNYPGDLTPKTDYNDWQNIRGGNWYVSADNCRCASRNRLTPTSHGNMLGFRIIRYININLAEEAQKETLKALIKPAELPKNTIQPPPKKDSKKPL
ncbi:MAG: formylglycine-generating enzyme family protein [Lentisphaeria bacterium]